MPSRVIVMMVATVLLRACSGDDGPLDQDLFFFDTQIDAPVVGLDAIGVLGPRYEVGIPVNTWDVRQPKLDFDDVRIEPIALQSTKTPMFNGEIAGIRLIPRDQMESADVEHSCKLDYYQLAVHFRFAYLPPGTTLSSPQHEARCADGTLAGVAQSFSVYQGEFHVGYEPGKRVFGYPAPQHLVRRAIIGGREALVVLPPENQILGSSLAAMATPNGFIVVQTVALRFEEAIRVLAFIKCDDC